MSRLDLAVGAGTNGAHVTNGAPGPGPGGRDRRPRRFSRGTRIALIAIGVLLFLAISGVLARYFSAENVEHDHEWALMQAEARGDAQEMLAQLSGCRAHPACGATVRADAASLRRAGSVEILSVQSPTDHSLAGAVGEARVAWKVSGRYPVVQCVRVRRSGNILTGISIALLSVGPRIGSTSDC
ncbi:MAG TPA: hypothetical protein VNV37_02225 [Solirubrobacteraceae bacterium]|jgi:hypothetical protein|nr:hypothetical protein [Solirubrobacteraceae bacterium]